MEQQRYLLLQSLNKFQFAIMLTSCFVLVVTINSTSAAIDFESHIIETLPGYPGPLPFNLETGYVGVGENNTSQLFYYFFESERDPIRDPLIFWIAGGPGCSGLTDLVYESGPLAYDDTAFDGGLPPSFRVNPYSFTKVASIIFVDSPAGTGYSYSTTPEGYPSSDTKTVNNNYDFLRKWLLNHPSFMNNFLYIAGVSYGGKTTPMLTLKIVQGNEAGLQPQMNIQGYIVGNSITDTDKDFNERIPYFHRMAIISDEYYELAKSSCKGEYVNPDSNDYECLYALQLIKECTNKIHGNNILLQKCVQIEEFHISLGFAGVFAKNVLALPKGPKRKEDESGDCRNHSYEPDVWADSVSVREALHVRKGTTGEWNRCNKSLSYEYDVKSVQYHHKLLSEKGYQVLAYSGDHDSIVPYMSTLKWIRALNITLDDTWRPWFIDGQIAGYTETYKNNQAHITFATVKGAGHTAARDKPRECFHMIKRWLALSSL